MAERDNTPGPGPARLQAWLDGPPKHTQEELVDLLAAKGVETNQQSVSRWLRGVDAPSEDKFPALTEITDIRIWEFWDRERAKKFRAAMEAKPGAAA